MGEYLLMKSSCSQAHRTGAYYTPPALAQNIVSLAAGEQRDGFRSVLEPSCGDGSFLVPLGAFDATRRASVTAFDIDPVAAAAARAKAPRADVRCGDFFDFCALALPEGRRFNLVVGNPPWVCYQTMSAPERKKLRDVQQFLGLDGNGLSNLWIPFTAACVSLLERDGLIAFLLPCDILWGSAAGELRALLLRELAELTIISFAEPFPELEQSMALLLGRKGDKKGVSPTKFRALPHCSWRDLPKTTDELAVPFSAVLPTERKWTPYLLDGEECRVAETITAGTSKLVLFSDLADVSVGVTTGRDEFFVAGAKTVAEWCLASAAVPLVTPKELRRCGLRLHERDNNAPFLLYFPNLPLARYPRLWRNFIEEAETKGLHKNYKCAIRPRWYVLPRHVPPDAFMSSIVHELPRLVLSDGRSTSTSALRHVRFASHVDTAKVAVSFYNSATLLAAELAGRVYGGGALQLTPGDIRSIAVPDPTRFELAEGTASEVDTLLAAGRYEPAISLVDRRVLVEGLGLDERFCAAAHNAWRTLRNRRLWRAAAGPQSG